MYKGVCRYQSQDMALILIEHQAAYGRIEHPAGAELIERLRLMECTAGAGLMKRLDESRLMTMALCRV